MGREMKFALITGGSMVLGATVFALITHARNHAMPPPYVPVTTSRELDSLSEVATHAPAPPAPSYTPTWISTDDAADSSIRVGGTATLSSDEPSSDSRPAPPDRKEQRDAPSAYVRPPSTDPPPAPAPPSDTPQQTVNSSPSNNAELREMLRRGK